MDGTWGHLLSVLRQKKTLYKFISGKRRAPPKPNNKTNKQKVDLRYRKQTDSYQRQEERLGKMGEGVEKVQISSYKIIPRDIVTAWWL